MGSFRYYGEIFVFFFACLLFIFIGFEGDLRSRSWFFMKVFVYDFLGLEIRFGRLVGVG